ncbi:putative protein OS=Streptomyces aurantiogriseus OX=66870 GN=GCM10010251_32100 PE=4 SV=1 [Streptomyces aurantiogriseus]
MESGYRGVPGRGKRGPVGACCPDGAGLAVGASGRVRGEPSPAGDVDVSRVDASRAAAAVSSPPFVGSGTTPALGG